MAEKKTAEAARPMPKTTVYKELADKAGLEANQVAAIFDALEDLIKQELGKKGPGLFAIPNLIKLKCVKKPATKAGMKPNPFKKGEMMEVKAKPASVKVKAVTLKGLKDLKAKK
jgi:nucleoid DNA-binding protein